MNISSHQGAVLYFWNEHLKPNYPHWHIVLNLNSVDDKGCFVSICTSKVAPLRTKIDKGYIKADTVVFMSKDDYCEFTCETAINCHKIDFITKEDLHKLIVNKSRTHLRQCKNFPHVFLNKIIDGVLLSQETDIAARAAILGVEESEVPDEMFKRFGMKLKDHLPLMFNAVAVKNTFIPKGNPNIRIVITPH